ncbi:MAG: DsbA family protein [Methanomicrobiales archaeon]|nr:DsbA family protein [Methanomicrobiales archaeon]
MRTRAAIDPIILVVIAGIAILAVVVFLVMSSSSPPVPAVSAQRCGDQTLSYVNDNLATEGTTATLVKAEDQHGMYRVTVAYQGQQIPLYTTTDCTLLFTEAMEMGASQPGVTASACGDRMLSYVNQNLAAEGTAATLVSVEDQHGMYRVTVAYQGQQYPFYATPDCTLLFLEGMDMTAPEATPTPAATPVQTDRPAVDLFVMSYCPYGTQAEAAMKPVADLLGAKADIRVRYITSVGGTTVDSIESLHGAVEAQEDLRQACIEKYSPMKFWGYLAGFNSECYSTARTPESAAACSKNVTSALGIDQAEIDACATGAEGIGLLSTDVASAMVQDATASPTLLINGVEFSGSRSPEAYKQAICGSFTNAPAECETKLSEQQASVGGTC